MTSTRVVRQPQPTDSSLPSARGVVECVELICDSYHTPLLRDLAHLHVALREARKLFVDPAARFDELLRYFGEYRRWLETHIFKEEQILFPGLLGEERQSNPVGSAFVMQREHDEELGRLELLCGLAEACPPPRGAASAWAELMAELAALERFQRRHIEVEADLLLPMVMGAL